MAKLGTKHSEETRRKISMANKGHVVSHETRKKLSASSIGKHVGEKSGLWKGGSLNWWKKNVLQSQNYTCQRCGLQDYSSYFMEVDHIKQKANFPELALDLSNGQVLCPNCHRRKTMEDKIKSRPIH